MKAIQFIKDHGVEKAREVVEGAPEGTTHFRYSKFRDLSIYYDLFSTPKIAPMRWNRYSNNWYQLKTKPRVMIYFEQLKRLVESFELVGKNRGLKHSKFLIEQCEKYECWKIGSRATGKQTCTYEELKQAIADYEAIGGEHV